MSKLKDFKVGMRVRCIVKPRDPNDTMNAKTPWGFERGHVYTIMAIDNDKLGLGTQDDPIFLNGWGKVKCATWWEEFTYFEPASEIGLSIIDANTGERGVLDYV